MRHTREFKFGSTGEGVVRDWLKAHGFAVLPVSLIDNGGAPVLIEWVRQTVIPDIQAFGEAGPRWVEVKTKEKSVEHQITRERRTGFAERHFHAYMQVEATTHMPVWICFVHSAEAKMLLGPLRQASVHATFGRSAGVIREFGEAMIFFPIDIFEQHRIDGNSLKLLRNMSLPAKTKYPWENSIPVTNEQQFRLDFGESGPATKRSMWKL